MENYSLHRKNLDKARAERETNEKLKWCAEVANLTVEVEDLNRKFNLLAGELERQKQNSYLLSKIVAKGLNEEDVAVKMNPESDGEDAAILGQTDTFRLIRTGKSLVIYNSESGTELVFGEDEFMGLFGLLTIHKQMSGK